MITIFTIPKEFKGEYDRIQQNAIVSWLTIVPKPEIYLFGSEYGIDDVARKYNIHHIPEIQRSSSGVPLINDVFEKAQNLSMYDTVCFINADIILPPDFFDVINIVQKKFKNFSVRV